MRRDSKDFGRSINRATIATSNTIQWSRRPRKRSIDEGHGGCDEAFKPQCADRGPEEAKLKDLGEHHFFRPKVQTVQDLKL